MTFLTKCLVLNLRVLCHEEHGVGCGYVCKCDGMNVRELAQRAKDVLGCRVVRFSGGEREIRRVEYAQVQAVRSLLTPQKKAVRCF